MLRVIYKCIVSVHFDSFVTYFVAICPIYLGLKSSQIRTFIIKYNGGCLSLISLYFRMTKDIHKTT